MANSFVKTVPALPRDFKLNNLAAATAIQAAAPVTTSGIGTYNVDLKRDWCMGLVPHGGILTALLAAAASHHMTLHHPTRPQPDLITLHVEFIERTFIGPASITITLLKPGRQFSTLRVQLFQSPTPRAPSALCLEALIRQGNLAAEALSGGITLPTRAAALLPPVLPLRADCVEHRDSPPMFVRRTAFAKVVMLVPRSAGEARVTGAHPEHGPSVREQWVTWRRDEGFESPGVGFNLPALCFLADAFIPLPEAYGLKGNWFPTLSCGVEVKRAPPAGGWEWLFMRVETWVVRDGRCDIEVWMWDEEGELVAISRHAALIVGSERNLKAKGGQL